MKLKDSRHRLLERLRQEIHDDRVISAMARVPREAFIPEYDVSLAYEDAPLPIGEGQTISQPFIVALMVSSLELRRTDKVLEIGTGSGYQAAVLAELAREVISVERIETLRDSARQTLRSLGYTNVDVRTAGVELGHLEGAPYDAIVVAAGAPKLPRELTEQLTVGGRLVIPVGSQQTQELMKVTRTGEGSSVATLGACRFVPLIGKGAWPEENSQLAGG